MLTRREHESETKRNEVTFMNLEDMVPPNHLVRKIESVMDWKWIYEKVEHLYSEELGRPSIDPIVLVKLSMLQLIFGIDSMRQTISETEMNLAYRWFLGYGIHDKIPHHSTVGKNFIHRFEENEIAEEIFAYVLERCKENGLVDTHTYFVDSTHVKASANKNKLEKKEVEVVPKAYQKAIEAKVAEERETRGKRPLKKKEKKTKIIKVSKTDPDSGLFYKNEKEKCLAYSFHTACDCHGFVVGVEVTGANVHDSVMLEEVLKISAENAGKPQAVSADAGYKTPHNIMMLMEQDIRPVLPYTRPKTKDGFFKKYEFVYDEYFDVYICPQGRTLD